MIDNPWPDGCPPDSRYYVPNLGSPEMPLAVPNSPLLGGDGALLVPVGVGNGLAIANGILTTAEYINLPVASQIVSVFPTANPTVPTTPTSTLTSANITGVTAVGPQREFLVNLGLTSNKGAPTTNNNDKVTLYVGLDAMPGTADCWTLNTCITQTPGSGSYNCFGHELDYNNNNADRGNTGNTATDFSAPTAYGLGITGAGFYSNTSALLIGGFSNRNVNYPQWNRGISLTGTMGICGYNDITQSPIAMKFEGGYQIGIDFSGGVIPNFAPALYMPNSVTVTWKNGGSIISDTTVGPNRQIGIGSSSTILYSTTYPVGGGIDLGRTDAPFAHLYVVASPVVTSDVNFKHDISAIPDGALSVVTDIVAHRYRLNEDTSGRLHYGFLADEVKAAFDAHELEFGGYYEGEGGRRALAYEEMISVLWKAVQELTTRVVALEAP
jgi:hypothetical protein